MPDPALDQFDVRIVSALQANARLTVAELSSQVGLATSPCWRRVKRLEGAGVISDYSAVLDRRKLGWEVMAFVNVTIGDHSEAEALAFERAAMELPEIVACWGVSGTSDFVLLVVGLNLDAFGEFAMTVVRRMPGIKAMHTTFVLKEVKTQSGWPVPGQQSNRTMTPAPSLSKHKPGKRFRQA
jgi:DNA-binding Lrp family transcriptional regulator